LFPAVPTDYEASGGRIEIGRCSRHVFWQHPPQTELAEARHRMKPPRRRKMNQISDRDTILIPRLYPRQ